MEKLKLAFPTAFSELVECFGEKQAEIELEKLVERQKVNPKLDLEDKPLLAAFVWEETEQGHEVLARAFILKRPTITFVLFLVRL